MVIVAPFFLLFGVFQALGGCALHVFGHIPGAINKGLHSAGFPCSPVYTVAVNLVIHGIDKSFPLNARFAWSAPLALPAVGVPVLRAVAYATYTIPLLLVLLPACAAFLLRSSGSCVCLRV